MNQIPEPPAPVTESVPPAPPGQEDLLGRRSGAALIDQLGSVLYVGAALIFVLVMTLAIVGVVAKGRDVAVKHWVIGGGLMRLLGNHLRRKSWEFRASATDRATFATTHRTRPL